METSTVIARLGGLGIEGQGLLAVAIDRDPLDRGPGLGLATPSASRAVAAADLDDGDPLPLIAAIEEAAAPRWVWWDRSSAAVLAAGAVPIARCWDVSAVHRLLVGRFRATIGEIWAHLNDLDPSSIPTMGQLDLLAAADEGGDRDEPVRPDGHLRPEWIAGRWRETPEHLARWAGLALRAATLQHALLERRADPERARSTANAESVAELLCAELANHGLPIDATEAGRIITRSAGPRPTGPGDEARHQQRRDEQVLRHLAPPQGVNLRNPADVKAMLRRNGFDLPDTRARRLEELRDSSPLIDALLTWRKAERIATTYGWGWLDEHVSGGRLRGEWSSSDGAAGRMTASAGLHNLPAPMRSAVAAEPGHRFVRADLGQIEPRVLAAVSGDRALIAATAEADLYRPVAERLGAEREVAKVAFLAAMYGSTTGESAGALRGLQRSYPVAMAFLEDAAREGRRGNDVLTIGGRLVRIGGGPTSAGPGPDRGPGSDPDPEPDPGRDADAARAAAAARGRYARNALIQGAAAELFKVWAIIVRRRVLPLGARIVLCLHDELLVHAPTDRAEPVADAVTEALAEAAFYWSPEPDVRFVVDTGIIARWSEAKE